MRILVVGGGGREHALAACLASEEGVEVVCCPGNPGIAEVARCLPIPVTDTRQLLELVTRNAVDLTVVGPELPLSLGIVDAFRSEGRAIVGPTRAAAALESSKAFAKDFMTRHAVPTARYHVCSDADAARALVRGATLGFPVVVKADGLAAGKGVVIAQDEAAALAAIDDAMVAQCFGDAGRRVVLEECLSGPEASYFVLADGQAFVSLGSAQDHKRIFDDDRGPNTGGMGAFAPSPLLTPALERRVLDEVVGPVLAGMRAEGMPYTGFLYVGLMLTASGPKVIEFNVRFGDPEAQVVLPRIDGGLADLLMASATAQLASRQPRFRSEPLVGVVLAARGYPDTPAAGDAITGLGAAGAVPGARVFHAGTAIRGDALVTAGGRVLTVVGKGPTFRAAIDTAYRAVSHVRFNGMQFRSDIGRAALGAPAGP